jgi:hypothetical protein
LCNLNGRKGARTLAFLTALTSPPNPQADYKLVPAWTLDAHLDSLGEGHAPVLLLKVDAEGFDSHVLRGAARLLREQRAVFLTFEYNVRKMLYGPCRFDTPRTHLYPLTLQTKWKSDPDKATLHDVVEWLREFGYLCWFMTTTHLVPLSGRWWSDDYEVWAW